MASIPHWILTYPTLMATSVSSVFPVKKYYYQKSRDEARPSSTSTLSAKSAQREKSKSFRGPVDPSFVDENKFAGEYGPLCRKFLLTLDTERYRLSSRLGRLALCSPLSLCPGRLKSPFSTSDPLPRFVFPFRSIPPLFGSPVSHPGLAASLRVPTHPHHKRTPPSTG